VTSRSPRSCSCSCCVGGASLGGDVIEIAARVGNPVARGIELEVALEAMARLRRELGDGGTDAAELADRELRLVYILEQVREVVAGLGLVRVAIDRAFVEAARLLELALEVDQAPEVGERGRHARFEIARLSEQMLGELVVALVLGAARLDEVALRGGAAVHFRRRIFDQLGGAFLVGRDMRPTGAQVRRGMHVVAK